MIFGNKISAKFGSAKAQIQNLTRAPHARQRAALAAALPAASPTRRRFGPHRGLPVGRSGVEARSSKAEVQKTANAGVMEKGAGPAKTLHEIAANGAKIEDGKTPTLHRAMMRPGALRRFIQR